MRPGHTALAGAVDAQISVKRTGADQIVARVERMKDGPEGDQIISRLRIAEVGIDEDGEPVTSCVVEEAEAVATARPTTRLSDAAKIALDTLREAVAQAGSAASRSKDIPPTARTVEIKIWRQYFYAVTAADKQTPAARKKSLPAGAGAASSHRARSACTTALVGSSLMRKESSRNNLNNCDDSGTLWV